MGIFYTRKFAVYVAVLITLFALLISYKLIVYKQKNTLHRSTDFFKKNKVESKLVLNETKVVFFHSNNAIGIKNVLEWENIPSEIPEQWESPLMDILLNNKSAPEDRVKNLYEMAVGSAKGVARVQEECLTHLLYTIPDEQTDIFYKITTNSDIPDHLREDFLEKILTMRPESLCVPLCESLMYNKNYNLAKLCTKYLQDISSNTEGEN